jgi:hypothetical protein
VNRFHETNRTERETQRPPRPHPEESCAARRLEAWPQGTDSPPSFEARARSALLRMRLMNDVDMI